MNAQARPPNNTKHLANHSQNTQYINVKVEPRNLYIACKYMLFGGFPE